MGVSIRPSEAVEGGLVPADRNLLWKNPHFEKVQYIQKDGTPTLDKDGNPVETIAGIIDLVDDEGTTYNQRYSVGDPKRFTIENGGKTLGPDGVTISKSCNFYHLMNATVNAGFPENKLTDDFSQLDGLYAHHIAIPEPTRTGLVREAKEGQRPRVLSVPDSIIKLPWEGKGKTAPAASAKKAAAPVAEDAGNAEADALAMVVEMLSTADKVTRQQVATKAIRSKNQAVAKLVFTPKFAEVLTGAGFSLDGENITAG